MGLSKSAKVVSSKSMIDIGGFEYWLIESAKRPRTINKYLWHLKRLSKEVDPLTLENARSFFLTLKSQGCKNTYINDVMVTLKVYAKWAGLNDFLDLRQWKEEPVEKSTMSDSEIELFLSLPPPKNGSKALYGRWTLFFSILAYTGMRPNECATLTVDDIDFGRFVFCIRSENVKTRDNRLVPIPPHLLQDIHTRVTESTSYLFPSLRGGNKDGLGKVVDNVDWHYNFHSRLKRLGIKRRGLTPYSLRHSIITRLLEEDVNLFKVQKLVGHKRLDTTLAYTHLTTKDMHDTIGKDPLTRKRLDPKEKVRALKEYLKKMNLPDDPDIEYEYVETDKGFKLEVKVKEGNP